MQKIYTLSLTLLAAFGVCLPSVRAGKKTPLPVPLPRQQYNIASPPGFGGAGGGGGRGGFPQQMRINARDWSDSRKLDALARQATGAGRIQPVWRLTS